MRLGVALVALALLPRAASAQWEAAPRFPVAEAGAPIAVRLVGLATPLPPGAAAISVGLAAPTEGELVVVGLAAAAAGFIGGGLLGYHAERRWFWCACDDPGLIGGLVGAFAGPALVTPVVVHAVNGRRGSLSRSYATSAMIGGLGFVLTLAMARSEAGLVPLFGTPLVQGINAAIVEMSTAGGP